MVKKNVMTSIDDDLHEKAKMVQMNVSQVLEDAIRERLRIKEHNENVVLGRIEFDFEERDMKSVTDVFAGVAIRARRCTKCARIWFVNDLQHQWKICKDCRAKGLGENILT